MVGRRKAPSERAAPGSVTGDGNGITAHELGRERVIEIQRARILAAMVEVSAERGAGNVSVAHVVERAGVSRRTFYELFDDREECFLAAFDDAIARACRYVLDAYDPNARWAERLRIALAGLLTFLDVERGAGRLLIVGSLGAGASALERRRRVLAQMITLIDEGRKESKTGSQLPPLTAEGVVGGVLSVLHARLVASPPPPEGDSLLGLTSSLMGMIVLPYLGPAVARKELARPTPKRPTKRQVVRNDPLQGLPMRLTYRTMRVLVAVAAHPGSSNRAVGECSGIPDQGQASKLLARLRRLGLIENEGGDPARGEPNAWTLTTKGREVHDTIARLGG
jgi:AcrR family transcriptional regulator/DNA-binding MarR family transcriptional regulator